MMHRVTMRDGQVWYLEEDHDENPVRMTFSPRPKEIPFEQWNHTPHSYAGSGCDLVRLAMDIAKWAEMEEYQVAEIVPLTPTGAKSPTLTEAIHLADTEMAATKKRINDELITIRKAMRRIERLLEDL